MMNVIIYIPLTVGVLWFWCRVALWAYLHGRQSVEKARLGAAKIRRALEALRD